MINSYPKNITSNPKLLVCITITIWAFVGLVLKLIVHSKPFVIVSIGLLASSLVNFIYYRKSGGGMLLRWDLKFIFFSLCGYFFYWVFLLLTVEAYEDMVSPPVVLNYTWPFFTGLFTMLMYRRQKADWVFFLSMICGLLGIAVLASKGSLQNLQFLSSLTGLVLGIAAGASYGLFSAYSSSLKTDVESAQYLLTGTLLGAFFLGGIGYYRHGDALFQLSTQDWIIALSAGLLLDALGYILWTRAQAIAANRKIDITQVVSLANYLPLLSLTIVGLFFEDEREMMLQPYFIVAFFFIFLSSLLPHIVRNK